MRKYLVPLLLSICIILSGCSLMDRIDQAALDIELAEENVYTLTDGTPVDLWRYKNGWNAEVYRVGDQSILRVDYPGSYESWASDLNHWKTMSTAAQEKVLNWFESRGAQFHLDGEYADLVKGILELSYADYMACEDSGETFDCWYEGESVNQVASNEHILVFETTVKGGEGWFAANVSLETAMNIAGKAVTKDPVRTTQIFDAATGEPVEIEQLFTVSREEAEARLTQLFQDAYPEVTVDQIDLEYLLPDQDGMAVVVPQDVTGEEVLWYRQIEYKQIEDILQPWVLGLE